MTWEMVKTVAMDLVYDANTGLNQGQHDVKEIH